MTFTSHISRHGTKNCHQHFDTGLSLSFESPVSSQSFFVCTPVAFLMGELCQVQGSAHQLCSVVTCVMGYGTCCQTCNVVTALKDELIK